MAVRVNGEVVVDERFHREFVSLSGGRIPQQVQQQSMAEFQQLLQAAERNVLQSALLHQFALREGLQVTPDEVEEHRRRAWGSVANESCGIGVTRDVAAHLLVQKAERHITRHVPRPDRREVESIYRANASSFLLPERWNVSHIVRRVETEAERAAAMEALSQALHDLKRGKAFAVVADRYSDCKGNGGALGWITRGSMVAQFEHAVFQLERRRPSDIFETVFGLHVAVVIDRKPAGLQPLEEVRNDLVRRIFEDRKASLLQQHLDELYRLAVIEVMPVPQHDVASSERVS